jgi:hypothetical protein
MTLKGGDKMDNKASLACQVRSNIRCVQEMKYQAMVTIFKNDELYNKEIHERYFLGFFEECYPKLIKKFMVEQDIKREQILSVFYKLPQAFGETYKFRKALENGEF